MEDQLIKVFANRGIILEEYDLEIRKMTKLLLSKKLIEILK